MWGANSQGNQGAIGDCDLTVSASAAACRSRTAQSMEGNPASATSPRARSSVCAHDGRATGIVCPSPAKPASSRAASCALTRIAKASETRLSLRTIGVSCGHTSDCGRASCTARPSRTVTWHTTITRIRDQKHIISRQARWASPSSTGRVCPASISAARDCQHIGLSGHHGQSSLDVASAATPTSTGVGRHVRTTSTATAWSPHFDQNTRHARRYRDGGSGRPKDLHVQGARPRRPRWPWSSRTPWQQAWHSRTEISRG